MDPTPTVSDLIQLLQGAGTPMVGVLVFLLYRLNKEVAEMKVKLETFTEVISKYLPKAKE